MLAIGVYDAVVVIIGVVVVVVVVVLVVVVVVFSVKPTATASLFPKTSMSFIINVVKF